MIAWWGWVMILVSLAGPPALAGILAVVLLRRDKRKAAEHARLNG